jgi:hypothetical protein
MTRARPFGSPVSRAHLTHPADERGGGGDAAITNYQSSGIVVRGFGSTADITPPFTLDQDNPTGGAPDGHVLNWPAVERGFRGFRPLVDSRSVRA